MAFLEEVAVALNAAGVGVYPGTALTKTINIAHMPDSPDLMIALYAEPGRPKALHCDLEYPVLHVESRAATYGASQTKALEIDAALHGQHDISLSGIQYLEFKAMGIPVKLEVDARGRTIFYQNFEVIKGA